MNQLTIQKMTKQAFEMNYDLNERSYDLTELGQLIDQAQKDTVCILVEDKLYVNPMPLNDKQDLTNEEIVLKLETLNESFRDALIHLREFLYSGNRGIEAEQKKKEIQSLMNQYIHEAKGFVEQGHIMNQDHLKKASKKYFMVEFLNAVFENEVYDAEIEIDCGL